MEYTPLLSDTQDSPPPFEPSDQASPPAYPIQTYAIQRYDTNSAILLDPAPNSRREPRFAVRIHSNSIYLYRPGKEDLFEKPPVMEASITGFLNQKDAKLDDWREKSGGSKGKYRLRHQHGMHVYTGAEDDSKAWREDDRGCLHLTAEKSPTSATLACLNIPPITPCGGLDKLHNLSGRIDLLDPSVINGVEEELAILTCITTHVINRRSQA